MEATKRKYQKHKTDRKITLTYILNRKLKPTYDTEEERENKINPKYPIYIRIGFRGNNTSVKSRFSIPCSSENKLTIRLKEFSDFVNQEKEMIESLILETDVVDGEVYNFKEFGKLYQAYAKPTYEFLSNYFLKELLEIIRERNGGNILPGTKNFIYNGLQDKPDAIVYMSALFEDLRTEVGREYLQERSFLIKKYIGGYTHGSHPFHLEIGFDFCLFDIFNNFFQSEIKKHYHSSVNDISMKILEEIKCKLLGK